MNEISSTSRIVRWNRVILALLWAAVGIGCIGLLLWEDVRASKLAGVPAIAGAVLLVTSWGFYLGRRWGRVCIGVVMAFVALYCFDRLLYLGFRKTFSWFFLVLCAVLIAAFYTWLYLFSGLDRGGPLEKQTSEDDSQL